MSEDFVLMKKDAYDCVTKAYEWIFSLRKNGGDWPDVRIASLMMLCLSLREERKNEWLRDIKQTIEKEVKNLNEDQNGICWNDEIWDTSLALRALYQYEKSEKNALYQKGRKWIGTSFNKTGRENWNDEPWESYWAIKSILLSHDSKYDDILTSSIKWYLTLQSEDGKVVAAHYTAFLIDIFTEYMKKYSDIDNKTKELMNVQITKAKDYLTNQFNKKNLWTGEAWSNSYILQILINTNNFDEEKIPLNDCLKWYIDLQDEKGMIEDGEDTALSILAIIEIIKILERKNVNQYKEEWGIYSELRKRLGTPILKVKRPMFHTHADGTITINIKKNLRNAGSILIIATGTISTIITFRDQIFGWFT